MMTRSKTDGRRLDGGECTCRSRFRASQGSIAAVACLVLVISLSPASAAVLTVGDHGTYSEIEAAIDVAFGAGSTEIRVEQGTYVENLYFGSGFISDDIEITGGWNSTFSARSSDASLTVIDGSGLDDPVIVIRAGGGSVLVDGFTITNGVDVAGGGIWVEPTGDTVVTASNNNIIGNVARSTLPAGGGVYFRQISGTGRLYLLNNWISGNVSENTGSGGASGGGVHLYVQDEWSFVATGNRITDNTCIAPGHKAYGCGANLYVQSSADSEFSDNLVKGNRTVTAAGSEVEGAGGSLGAGIGCSGSLTARRNLFIDNRDNGTQEGYHVKFSAQETCVVEATDNVIAGGPNTGVGAWSYDSSTLHLTNLTIFDHADLGILIRGFGSESTLFNTIVYGSTTPVDSSSGVFSTGANLLGVDPLFVNPAVWDCRLQTGSPALDEGDNSPPGGLGPTDPDGNPRVLDVVVDIGAYEGAVEIFRDGFESGVTSFWSPVVP
jgi:hypothetical protein